MVGWFRPSACHIVCQLLGRLVCPLVSQSWHLRMTGTVLSGFSVDSCVSDVLMKQVLLAYGAANVTLTLATGTNAPRYVYCRKHKRKPGRDIPQVFMAPIIASKNLVICILTPGT